MAELTTAYVCSRFGIDSEITNNAAYIQYWLKALQNDNKFFLKAAGKAQRAAEFIFNYSDPALMAA